VLGVVLDVTLDGGEESCFSKTFAVMEIFGCMLMDDRAGHEEPSL